MTETTTELTLVERYRRLDFEHYTLRRVEPDERTADQRARLVAVHHELREILAAPPAGYELPKAATDLLAFAEAHGWMAQAQWTSPEYDGEPYVSVQVARRVTEAERDQYRGDRWSYQLTWHSRDCAAGKVRRFGSGTAITPGSPSTHDAPSVKAIRAVIEANPAPGRGAES
jgi:hypothetical protein